MPRTGPASTTTSTPATPPTITGDPSSGIAEVGRTAHALLNLKKDAGRQRPARRPAAASTRAGGALQRSATTHSAPATGTSTARPLDATPIGDDGANDDPSDGDDDDNAGSDVSNDEPAAPNQLPRHGEWSLRQHHALAPPPASIDGGPARQDLNPALALLHAACPLGSLRVYAQQLHALGLRQDEHADTLFSDVEELDIMDLEEAGVPRMARMRICFAMRHFDARHNSPEAAATRRAQALPGLPGRTAGTTVNERLANLHHLGFDMPISIRPRKESHYSELNEAAVVALNSSNATVRRHDAIGYPRAPDSVVEYLYHGAWVVVMWRANLDGDALIAFHDGTQLLVPKYCVRRRFRECSQKCSLGISESEARRCRQEWVAMSTPAQSPSTATTCVAAAYPPFKTARQLGRPQCIHPECRRCACASTRKPPPGASATAVFHDGFGLLCEYHRLYYYCRDDGILPLLDKTFTIATINIGGRSVRAPCLARTNAYLLILDTNTTVALPRSVYDAFIGVDADTSYSNPDDEVRDVVALRERMRTHSLAEFTRRRTPGDMGPPCARASGGGPPAHGAQQQDATARRAQADNCESWHCVVCDKVTSAENVDEPGAYCACKSCGTPRHPLDVDDHVANKGHFVDKARTTLSAEGKAAVAQSAFDNSLRNELIGNMDTSDALATDAIDQEKELRAIVSFRTDLWVYDDFVLPRGLDHKGRPIMRRSLLSIYGASPMSMRHTVVTGLKERHSTLGTETHGSHDVQGFECMMGHGKHDVTRWQTLHFPTVVHFLAAAAASMFGDWQRLRMLMEGCEDPSAALRIAAEVLADCDDRRERTLQWRRVMPRALYAALKRKFCTPGEAQDALMGTGTRRIAYADKSSASSALGTGLDKGSTLQTRQVQWTGANLMGDMLAKVRGLIASSNLTHGENHDRLLGFAGPGKLMPAQVADINDTDEMIRLVRMSRLRECEEDEGFADLSDPSEAAMRSDPHMEWRPHAIHLYSPSCKPFSWARFRTRGQGHGRDRERMLHIDSVVKIILATRPLCAIIENVTQLLQHKVWREQLPRLKEAGLKVVTVILHAQHAAIPLVRRRAFVFILPNGARDFITHLVSKMDVLGCDPVYRASVQDCVPGVLHFYTHRRWQKFPGVWSQDQPVPAMLTSCLNPPRDDYMDDPHPDDSAALPHAVVLDRHSLKLCMGFPFTWRLPPVGEKCNCSVCNGDLELAATALGNSVAPPMMTLIIEAVMSWCKSIRVVPTGLDFFCGHGGSGHGATLGGLEVARAFDRCPKAVRYYNINASHHHDDPHRNGDYRAIVWGIPVIEYDKAGSMSSVRVVVGRGRLGVAFKGRHVIYKESKFRWRAVTRTQARYDDASPWTVIGTKSVWGRQGPLEDIGVRQGWRLVAINSIDTISLCFPNPLTERGRVCELLFKAPRARATKAARDSRSRRANQGGAGGDDRDPKPKGGPAKPRPRDASTKAPAAQERRGGGRTDGGCATWHTFPMPTTCLAPGCDHRVFGTTERPTDRSPLALVAYYCSPSCRARHRRDLIVSNFPRCRDPACTEPCLSFGSAGAANYCTMVCALPPQPPRKAWHGQPLQPRCARSGCYRKCRTGSDFCREACLLSHRIELAQAGGPMCKRLTCVRAAFRRNASGPPSAFNQHWAQYCSAQCMAADSGAAARPEPKPSRKRPRDPRVRPAAPPAAAPKAKARRLPTGTSRRSLFDPDEVPPRHGRGGAPLAGRAGSPRAGALANAARAAAEASQAASDTATITTDFAQMVHENAAASASHGSASPPSASSTATPGRAAAAASSSDKEFDAADLKDQAYEQGHSDSLHYFRRQRGMLEWGRAAILPGSDYADEYRYGWRIAYNQLARQRGMPVATSDDDEVDGDDGDGAAPPSAPAAAAPNPATTGDNDGDGADDEHPEELPPKQPPPDLPPPQPPPTTATTPLSASARVLGKGPGNARPRPRTEKPRPRFSRSCSPGAPDEFSENSTEVRRRKKISSARSAALASATKKPAKLAATATRRLRADLLGASARAAAITAAAQRAAYIAERHAAAWASVSARTNCVGTAVSTSVQQPPPTAAAIPLSASARVLGKGPGNARPRLQTEKPRPQFSRFCSPGAPSEVSGDSNVARRRKKLPGARSAALASATRTPAKLAATAKRRLRADLLGASARAAAIAAVARRAAYIAERHAAAWASVSAHADCVGTAVPTSVLHDRLSHLSPARAAPGPFAEAIAERVRKHDAARNPSAAQPASVQDDARRRAASLLPDPDVCSGNVHIAGLRRTERRRLAAQMATALRDDGTCRDVMTALWPHVPHDAFPTDTSPRSMYSSAPPRHPQASNETHSCNVSQHHERWRIAHLGHCTRCQEFSFRTHGVRPPLAWARSAWRCPAAHAAAPVADTPWTLDPGCYQARMMLDLRTGFDPEPLRPVPGGSRRNGPSCWNEWHQLEKYMAKIEKLRCLSPPQWSLPTGATVSAMHCVVRASDVRAAERDTTFEVPVRTVTDFTASRVNECFPDWRFRMAGIDAAVHLLGTMKNPSLGSVDIHKAFPSLPLGVNMQQCSWIRDPRSSPTWGGSGAPSHQWRRHNDAVRAGGTRRPPFRRWIGLPLGFKLAPAFACAVTGEIAQYLKSIGVTVCVFVDDFLVIAPDDTLCTEHIATVTAVIEWLGLKTSPGKTEGPLPEIKFLGLLFSPLKGTITITDDRRTDLLSDVRRLLGTAPVLTKDLESVVGKLGFAASICRGARAYLQRLRAHLTYCLQTAARNGRLGPNARLDAQWWLRTLQAPMAGSTICYKHDMPEVINVKSDASGTMGFGYVYRDILHYSRYTDDTAADYHIGYKETLALVHIAEEYGHMFTGKILRCGVDNSGVVFSILRGSTKCKRTQQLLRRLADAQIAHQFTLLCCHVSRSFNLIADKLTRHARMQDLNEVLPPGVTVDDSSTWGLCRTRSAANNEPVYFVKLKLRD